MIGLLKCEYRKTRRRYVFITALVITACELVFAFYGKYEGFILENGWMSFLYQLPLINSIFFPVLSIVVASRLCDIEHKGQQLKLLCTMTEKGRLYDAKLLYGLGIVSLCLAVTFGAEIIFGKVMGFGGELPVKLYLIYMLFTAAPTFAVYVFQHTLSMLFKNQAIPFFAGIIGEFAGLFSMFLPQLPALRKAIIWGYYGVLQFVGLYGWTKETRYENAYFEIYDRDWTFFAVLVVLTVVMYLIGRKLFDMKEV